MFHISLRNNKIWRILRFAMWTFAIGLMILFPILSIPLRSQEPISLDTLRQLDSLVQSGMSPEEASQHIISKDVMDEDRESSPFDLTEDSPAYRSPENWAFRWSAEIRLTPGAMVTVEFPDTLDRNAQHIDNEMVTSGDVEILPPVPSVSRILGTSVAGGTMTVPTDAAGGLLRLANYGVLPFSDDAWHQLELVLEPGSCVVFFDGERLLKESRNFAMCCVQLTCLEGVTQLRKIHIALIQDVWPVDASTETSTVTDDVSSKNITEKQPFSEDAEKLANEIESEMDRGLEAWYRNSVDQKQGGFHTNLNRQWDVTPYTTKGIVHQARMTWTVAYVALHVPKWREKLEPIAIHGGQFLRNQMWDSQCGGFHWEVAVDGTPLTSTVEMKHSYGIAFGIYAMSTLYSLTKNEQDRELAIEAFRWLDTHGHDANYGGYCEAFYTDGTPMIAPPMEAPWLETGKVGEPLGGRSMNTHLHLLEAFTALYKIWPDAILQERLKELFYIIRDRITTSGSWGSTMRLYFDADWTPAATGVSFGHDVETAFLLYETACVLELSDDPKTQRVIQGLVDHAIRWGWDKTHSGFHDEGATYAIVTKREKAWWAQAESLNALLLMHVLYGSQNTDNYYSYFVQQWQFIRNHVLDKTYGGWYSEVDESGNLHGMPDKGNMWKTPYHETRSMLQVVERLRNKQ